MALLVIVVPGLILSGCNNRKTYVVQPLYLKISSLSQIRPISDSVVKPILYSSLVGFDRLPPHEGKPKFISAVLPAILIAKHNVETIRQKVAWLNEKAVWDRRDSLFFKELTVRYGGRSPRNMLERIGTLPTSIVLAQAAIESGWGESRFFVEGRNVFGIWSFKEDEPRMAAGQGRGNKIVYVRSYDDVSESIEDYFDVLTRSGAYRTLRIARTNTNDPYKLIPHLINYSERKTGYTQLVKAVIEQNDLTRFDRYRLDPCFLVEEE
jgi:Bax protein